MQVTTHAPDETLSLGRNIGKLLKKGDFLALDGDLGAGKTLLIKGIAEGLGLADSRYVTSPTFVLMHEYQAKVPLYHFDVYRIEHPDQMNDIGYREYFYGGGVCVLEWASRIRALCPDERINIRINVTGATTRKLTLKAKGARAENIMKKMKKAYV